MQQYIYVGNCTTFDRYGNAETYNDRFFAVFSLCRIQTDPGDRDIFAVHPLFRCQFCFVTGSVRVQVGVEIPGEKKLRLCSSTTQPRTHTTCCSCQAEGANIKLNLS
jgi:hypothetical protein